MPIHVTEARLEVPQNRQTPIGVEIAFSHNVRAVFDWRQTGPQTWEIVIETDDGGDGP